LDRQRRGDRAPGHRQRWPLRLGLLVLRDRNLGILYAVAGTVQGWHNDRSGDERVPAGIPEWREATTAEANPVAAAVALLDGIMGLRVRSEWFTEPRRTTPIPDVDQLLPRVTLGKNISGGDIVQSDPAAWRP
jgi:hypothetical protein